MTIILFVPESFMCFEMRPPLRREEGGLTTTADYHRLLTTRIIGIVGFYTCIYKGDLRIQ
jgi:hypothetical protein